MGLFETVLQQYGWVGFVLYFVAREVFPFLRDRVYPHKVKQQDEERKRLIALEDRAAKNEERLTTAVETMSQSVSNMALAITTSNERLSQVIANQLEHARFTQDAIIDMRKVTAVKKLPRRK